MSFDLQLADRRALVTSGTKGIGAAVVETLRGAGAQVVATARSAPARPAEGVRYFTADLSTAEGASGVAESVLKHLGGIDIVVNVLGGSSAGRRVRGARRHGVAKRAEPEPDAGRSHRSRLAAVDDRAALRRHCPCDLDPARSAIAAVDDRLCSGKGGTVHL